MMQSTPSNDISHLPIELALSMEYPSSIQEWLIPDCSAMTSQEATDQERLGITRIFRPEYLNYQSAEYLTYLDNKRDRIRDCNFKKLFSERSRLAREAPLARRAYVSDEPQPKPKP
jgi:hypothetical protein